MHTIAQIVKPSRQERPIQLLDPPILVPVHLRPARDRHPVLRLVVLKHHLHRLSAVADVVEFVRVLVGEEEQVRPVAAGDAHAAAYGADAGSLRVQHAEFLPVDDAVEFGDLLG